MVHVITQADRPLYADALDGMHRDRKRVFVDRLKWDLEVVGGLHEVDRYDDARAVYLVALDPSGDHAGSMRLLPTDGPHILGDHFGALCEAPPPRGPGIWEVTRFCTNPDLADPTLVRKQLLVALVEFALLHEVRRYTCVTHMAGLNHLLAIGWDCQPLGLPQSVGGETLGALSIDITAETLSVLRDRAGFRAPVLRWEARHAA